MKNKSIEKTLKPFGTAVHTTPNDFNYYAKMEIPTADPEVTIYISWSYMHWSDYGKNPPTQEEIDNKIIDGFHIVTNRALAQKDWREDGYPGSWPDTIKEAVATLTAMQERMKQSMEDRKEVQA